MIKSVEWLNDNLNSDRLILLDSSLPSKKTRELQIPKTRFFDIKNEFSDEGSPFPNTMPSEKKFQEGARSLGINSDSLIVIYDNLGIYTSARVWYMFRSMGHEEVYVLDGGLPEWILKGYTTEVVKKSRSATGNFVAHFDDKAFCNIDLIRENIVSERYELIDARSAGRFQGTAPEPRVELESGNIKGSVNLPYTEVLSNGKFKSPRELASFFSKKKAIIFSCGSGITACIILLASEIASVNTEKCIFDGSWTEWAISNGLTK